MKILLVEDNVLNQKIVVFNLSKLGYNITTVTNGRDAIKEVKTHTFDLVLMDLMLPGMNGYEITKEIRKHEQNNKKDNSVPVIAITANTLDNDQDKCIKAGMNDYLPKPFTTDQLIEKIQQFI
ncbi:MAG: response regulator [Bacteroidota bacterium]